MKTFLLGIGVYVLGYLVIGLCAANISPTAELSYYYAIVFSVLYLSAVVAVCTSLVLKKLESD